jgi:hypothetical protein
MTLDTYADLFNDDIDRVATALDHDRSVAIEAHPERGLTVAGLRSLDSIAANMRPNDQL